MYVVVNKVEDEKFESQVKTGNGNSFSRYFDETPEQVAQLWQRDRAKLDTFSINVERYSQNHAHN